MDHMDIYGHIWTYMDIHEHIPALSGWLSLPAAGFGDLRKNTPLYLLSMYIVNLVVFHGFEASLDFFLKVDNLFK